VNSQVPIADPRQDLPPPKAPGGQAGSVMRARTRFWRHPGFGVMLAAAVGVAILALAALTYYIWLNDTSERQRIIGGLVVLILALILTLMILVAQRVVQLWRDRASGAAGSRLHVRLVTMFSVVAVLPAVIVAALSITTVNIGMDALFGDPVRTSLESAVRISQAYAKEHQELIKGDVALMANDLSRLTPRYQRDADLLGRDLSILAAQNRLSEAYIIDSRGNLLVTGPLSFALAVKPPSPEAFAAAQRGEVVILTDQSYDRVRALVALPTMVDTFLYVGRFVDARVLEYAEKTRMGLEDFRSNKDNQAGIQITYALLFILVAIMVLLGAMWFGLQLANQLVLPIGSLAQAAVKVGEGDLSARVDESEFDDEMAILSRAFNTMTSDLEHQRNELVDANNQLDRRRLFIETVLSGVTAGVIGLDHEFKVTLLNRSASTFLGAKADSLVGQSLAELVPEMADLIEDARLRPDRVVQGQIEITRGTKPRTLLARLAAERSGDAGRDFVVTLDDITELMGAQRQAAWSDVARRIAHEIKNPLTPIQLSAERLKRKYSTEIITDPSVFQQCTDTIIRQVRDIGRMVDEFSSFARLPSTTLKVEDMGEVLRQVMFLAQVANPDVDINLTAPDPAPIVKCDAPQIAQALTNVLKNACESIAGRKALDERALPKGRIDIKLTEEPDRLLIDIRDNGQGLPEALRHRLTEPYVTTRTKGTGLGLAMARKAFEDHGGSFEIDNANGSDPGAPGAIVRVSLARPTIDAHQIPPRTSEVKQVVHGT
jgi:two-component system nitrogen regulation sensor histidine kinase NtrY